MPPPKGKKATGVFKDLLCDAFRDKTDGQYITDCPFCEKEGHFYINVETGCWDCKVCRESGNPREFLRKYHNDVCTWTDDDLEPLSNRCIRNATLREWGVAWAPEIHQFILPFWNREGNVWSAQRYDPEKNTKPNKLTISGFEQGVFGLHLLSDEPSRPIILCEGIFDAAAVWDRLYLQGTEDRSDVLGVPGANCIGAVADHVGKRDIYVAFDHDNGGSNGCKSVLKRLRRNRIFRLAWEEIEGDFPEGYDLCDLLRDVPDLDIADWLSEMSVVEHEPKKIKTAETAECAEVLNCCSTEPFPVDVYPPAMRNLVDAGARSTNCRPEIIASTMLAVAGLSLGGKKHVNVKADYYPTPTVWIATVANSGHRKSPALNLAVQPLLSLEKQFEKQYRKNKEEEDNVIRQRTLTTESTLEGLIRLLRDNPHGLMVSADELMSWIGSFNKYRNGQGNDQAQLMSIFSNSYITIDRVGENLTVENPLLCMAGCIQPDMIYKLASNDNMHNGFMARLLFCYPPAVDMERDKAGISESVKKEYETLITKMYNWETEQPRCSCPSISPDAESIIDQWWDNHFKIELPKLSDPLESAWHKFEDYMNKFCLILHECHRISGNKNYKHYEIHPDNVERAIRLVDYFKAETLKVYEHIETEKKRDDIETIVAWIKERGGQVSARDLVTARKVKSTNEAKQLQVDLVGSGYGSIEQERSNRSVFVLEG